MHYGSDAVVLSEWGGCMKMLPLSPRRPTRSEWLLLIHVLGLDR